jgi:CheY-like chemotaxis protein
MVVEDDPDALKISAAILSAAGYGVVHAYGGKDALRKLQVQKVDLVSTDLAMPEMGGVELIAAITAAYNRARDLNDEIRRISSHAFVPPTTSTRLLLGSSTTENA